MVYMGYIGVWEGACQLRGPSGPHTCLNALEMVPIDRQFDFLKRPKGLPDLVPFFK
jgi:hypothetical protein